MLTKAAFLCIFAAHCDILLAFDITVFYYILKCHFFFSDGKAAFSTAITQCHMILQKLI